MKYLNNPMYVIEVVICMYLAEYFVNAIASVKMGTKSPCIS